MPELRQWIVEISGELYGDFNFDTFQEAFERELAEDRSVRVDEFNRPNAPNSVSAVITIYATDKAVAETEGREALFEAFQRAAKPIVGDKPFGRAATIKVSMKTEFDEP
jgi:hypothetical protein